MDKNEPKVIKNKTVLISLEAYEVLCELACLDRRTLKNCLENIIFTKLDEVNRK